MTYIYIYRLFKNLKTFLGKKSKAAKKNNTTSKVTKKVSFFESVFGREYTNVVTTSTAPRPGNNQYVR